MILARTTQPNVRAIARTSDTPVLMTIGLSHYVEFARFALDLKGVRYNERSYAPVQHILPVLATRVVHATEGPDLSDSSFVDNVREGVLRPPPDASKVARRANAKRSMAVPLLVLPNQQVLKDSWEIAAWAGLDPVPLEIKDILDKELGPRVRQLSYHHVLKPANEEVWTELCTSGQGVFWGLLWKQWLGAKVTRSMRKIFSTSSLTAADEAREALEAIERGPLGEAVRRARLEKRRFLFGERLGIADVALAALAAPLSNPQLYARGMFRRPLARAVETDKEWASEVARFSATDIGQFSLNFYAEHRKASE